MDSLKISPCSLDSLSKFKLSALSCVSPIRNVNVDMTNENVDFSGPIISFYSQDNRSIDYGDHVPVSSRMRMVSGLVPVSVINYRCCVSAYFD